MSGWQEGLRAERARRESEADPNRTLIIHPADLVGQADIARRAGWTRFRVEYLVKHDARFPLPITRLGNKRCIPVWDYREIEAYIAKTTPRR